MNFDRAPAARTKTIKAALRPIVGRLKEGGHEPQFTGSCEAGLGIVLIATTFSGTVSEAQSFGDSLTEEARSLGFVLSYDIMSLKVLPLGKLAVLFKAIVARASTAISADIAAEHIPV